MNHTITLLLCSLFLCSCALSDSASSASVYDAQKVIEKKHPILPSNNYLVDASKRQIFASLPYFKGGTYAERLKVVNLGTATIGSLDDNYATDAGDYQKPDRFVFKNNGYGHQVVISCLFEGDMADYNVVITNPENGEIILSETIVYGKNSGEAGGFIDAEHHRWWLN